MWRLSKKHTLSMGSFLLPFLLLNLLWISLQLAPFGENNLLVSDLGTQYLPFLNGFKRFFEEGNFSLFSFSDALGGNILSLSAYYLISPFNFLVLLFSYQNLPIAILLIITLKISFMGYTMFYYLKKTYNNVSSYTLLFSTSYSFCGFVTIYCLNFMWLDALILLPILVLGIQYLWTEKKYFLYAITLFFSIITNYYMGYMICIFAVFYSIYWYYQSSTCKKKSFKAFLIEGKLFFITSLFTGISTSFLLIPAIEGMLATNKTNFDVFSFLPYPKFGLSFFSQFGIGSINFDLRLDHLPIIFSGIFMLLLWIAYFTLPTITTKQKKYTSYLFIAIFLSFWIELVNTIWHMFQNPAGFPYRNTFIFSFLLIKFAYEAFLAITPEKGIPKKVPLIFSAFLAVGYLSLILSSNKGLLLSNNYIILSFLFIWITYLLFTWHFQKKNSLLKRLLQLLFFLCICLELGFNFWVSLKDIPFGNQEQYAKTFNNQEQVIANLSQSSTDLFRIKQTIPTKTTGFAEQNNGYNNPILYGYAGVSSYSSTLAANTQDILKNLGLYAKNDRRIAYVDNSQVINFLLNVAYQITPEKSQKEKNLSINDSTYVYKNSEAIGMGFLVPDDFTTFSLMNKQPIENQEQLLQTILPINQPYFVETSVIDRQKENDKGYVFKTKTFTDGEVYLYIPGLKWANVSSFKVNGKTINPSIYIATNQLYNLGYFENGATIELEIQTNISLDNKTVELKTLDEKKFSQFIHQQKQQAFELSKQDDGSFQGNIKVNDPQKNVLYLSIPYDSNWKITVDGNDTKPKKVLDNFIGIELTEGEHHLIMSYQPKSFFLGGIISLTILLGWLFYQVFRRKLK